MPNTMVGLGFPGGSEDKASAQNAGNKFDPWAGKIPWRRKWQPTRVSLPGKSLLQRSLVGCSPRGRKESGTTEQLTRHTSTLLSTKITSGRICNFKHFFLLF